MRNLITALLLAVPAAAQADLVLTISAPYTAAIRTFKVNLSASPGGFTGYEAMLECAIPEAGHATGTTITVYRTLSTPREYAAEVYFKLLDTASSRYYVVPMLTARRTGYHFDQLILMSDMPDRGTWVDPFRLDVDLKSDARLAGFPGRYFAKWQPSMILSDTKNPKNRSSHQTAKNGVMGVICEDLLP